MQLNFAAPINGYDDQPIKVSNAVEADINKGIEAKDAEYMTLGSMAIQALNTVLDKDKDLSAEKKVARATLSVLIHRAINGTEDTVVDVTMEDVVMMKELMNAIYAPLPLMRAFECFDPKVAEVPGKTETSE